MLGVAAASLCQRATTLPGQNASNAPSAGFLPQNLSDLSIFFLCSIFFSPNKFVFHSHRLAEGGKYIQPDAANFNSWRRHIRLLGDPPDEVVHAWEDVKVRQAPLSQLGLTRQCSMEGRERGCWPPPLWKPPANPHFPTRLYPPHPRPSRWSWKPRMWSNRRWASIKKLS